MSDEQDKEMLREIHSALMGSSKLKQEGLIDKVDRHEKWIQRADLKIAGVVGGVAVIVFLIELFFRH